MDLSRVNDLLANFDSAFLESYVAFEHVFVVRLEAGGGIWETFQAHLVFRNVQVLHISRAIHFPIGLRVAAEREAAAHIPPNSYDDQDTLAKCFIITRSGGDTGFYIYCDNVELQGIPENLLAWGTVSRMIYKRGSAAAQRRLLR